jgi:hypothetical protein
MVSEHWILLSYDFREWLPLSTPEHTPLSHASATAPLSHETLGFLLVSLLFLLCWFSGANELKTSYHMLALDVCRWIFLFFFSCGLLQKIWMRGTFACGFLFWFRIVADSCIYVFLSTFEQYTHFIFQDSFSISKFKSLLLSVLWC